MKIFKGFNPTGSPCPICDTTDDKPCTLIPIYGTNEGKKKFENYEAKAIHVDCLDLLYFPPSRQYDYATIIQKVEVKHEPN